MSEFLKQLDEKVPDVETSIITEEQEETEPPKTMAELYNLLKQLGSAWRQDNAYIVNEGQKNERTVTPQPNVSTVANVLENHCYFTFIGEGAISDVSKLYIYHLDLGYYVSSDDIFRKLVLKYDNRLTSHRFFNELVAYIRTDTKIQPPLSDYRYIPVSNGVYNIKTKQLEEFSPDFIITSKIKTSYNPLAKKPILGGWFDFDKWLNTLACNDTELVTLLWQIMNEAINPNRTRKKMVLLVGDGNNGKGTFQALLENLIGRENVYKRTEQLKEQATFEELVDKVALYESELLDYAERLLSDNPLMADSETAFGTLEMLDNEAIELFKSIDVASEYQGLEYYDTSINKED